MEIQSKSALLKVQFIIVLCIMFVVLWHGVSKCALMCPKFSSKKGNLYSVWLIFQNAFWFDFQEHLKQTNQDQLKWSKTILTRPEVYSALQIEPEQPVEFITRVPASGKMTVIEGAEKNGHVERDRDYNTNPTFDGVYKAPIGESVSLVFEVVFGKAMVESARVWIIAQLHSTHKEPYCVWGNVGCVSLSGWHLVKADTRASLFERSFISDPRLCQWSVDDLPRICSSAGRARCKETGHVAESVSCSLLREFQ